MKRWCWSCDLQTEQSRATNPERWVCHRCLSVFYIRVREFYGKNH